MNLERVRTYLPETLSTVRIIVALLFLEHGSAKLLGFPASPTPQLGNRPQSRGERRIYGRIELAL